MRNRLTVFILLAVGVVFVLLFARTMYFSRNLPHGSFTEKKLRILTYSTFIGASGPGTEILNQFKRQNACEIEVATAGDAGLLLERLKISEDSAPFDVVIGLDQLMLPDAKARFQWQDIPLLTSDLRPEALLAGSSPFVPFDWSPMSFVYRQGEGEPPRDFEELLLPRLKAQIALQDPHASSPGLEFFNWVKDVQGEHTVEFLTKLKPNVQSVSPTWAFSYGLFKKKQARFVFTYVTSLAFHWGIEKDRNYQIVFFAEGHPVQVEYAAVPKSCRECDLAKHFVKNLLDPAVQRLIMEKNFMFPVLKGIEAGTIYQQLPQVKVRSVPNPSVKDLSDWDKVFKR